MLLMVQCFSRRSSKVFICIRLHSIRHWTGQCVFHCLLALPDIPQATRPGGGGGESSLAHPLLLSPSSPLERGYKNSSVTIKEICLGTLPWAQPCFVTLSEGGGPLQQWSTQGCT